ncbi:glyoxylate reductase/hydroxypyruvate reductase-like [Haliotis rubra]|uniref:glyoxylate reductase/hydroxypyruvate reductase-like n=1 Tax=Haliotis rubra TaxID=36100 RepID=UPI001EE5A1D5|nr:glyoxylate reductase/hydroxypyruvate reductase-like [Haliotis rubra]
MAETILQTRAKVYVTRTVPQRGLDILLQGCNVSMWNSEERVPRGELLHSVSGVDGILCMRSDQIDREVLDAAGPSLRAVATMSTMTDHIDVKECNRRDIRVLVSPNQSTVGLADLTLALILLAWKTSNEAPYLDNCNLQNGTVSTVCLKNLRNKTFGIYGLTILGHSVAKRLKDLGVTNIIAADYLYSKLTCSSDIEIVSWKELITRSDIMCICVQHDNNPPEVFSKETFQQMKNTAVIVDCQNGNAMSYADLYEALRGGDIAAAGINDCNQEPVPFRYPLAGLQNCVFLPQTDERLYDLRHKLSMTVATSLTNALHAQDQSKEVC